MQRDFQQHVHFHYQWDTHRTEVKWSVPELVYFLLFRFNVWFISASSETFPPLHQRTKYTTQTHTYIRTCLILSLGMLHKYIFALSNDPLIKSRGKFIFSLLNFQVSASFAASVFHKLQCFQWTYIYSHCTKLFNVSWTWGCVWPH